MNKFKPSQMVYFLSQVQKVNLDLKLYISFVLVS